jgi:phage-related protein
MSLLGSTFDSFLANIGNILEPLYTIITLISNFITSLFTIFGTILSIIYSMFSVFEIFVSVLIDPYLILSVLVGFSLFYAAFAGQTRKDMVLKIFSFWRESITIGMKIAHAMYDFVVKLIVGILDMI